MNTPSPLVPQGTSPERGRSSLYFKILMIVSLHVVLIGGMLLQGCSKTSTTGGTTAATDTNAQPDITSLPPINTNAAPAVGPGPATSSYVATPGPAYTPPSNPPMNTLPTSPVVTTPAAPVAAASEGTEYVVTRGDTLAVIAKKNGVSLKALREANPGVDPRKLKIGAKLQIPAGVAATGGGGGLSASAETGDTSTYTVKAGDMLGRIAKTHGTTVAKIKALNDLKTSSIKVGQKLKLPAPKVAESTMPTVTPASAPTTPVYTPAPSYATTSQPAAGAH